MRKSWPLLSSSLFTSAFRGAKSNNPIQVRQAASRSQRFGKLGGQFGLTALSRAIRAAVLASRFSQTGFGSVRAQSQRGSDFLLACPSPRASAEFAKDTPLTRRPNMGKAPAPTKS